MWGLKEDTKSLQVARYIEPAIGHVEYGTVFGNFVPDGPPFYAVSKPAPDIEFVKAHDMACTGLGNLLERKAGKRVPFGFGGPGTTWDGGTPAWVSYFAGKWSKPFHLSEAKRWARHTGCLVLVMRRFRDANHDQGHVAFVCPDGKVLQSIHGPAGESTGLNRHWTIEQSHDGGYYELMSHPDWFLEYKGDEF